MASLISKVIKSQVPQSLKYLSSLRLSHNKWNIYQRRLYASTDQASITISDSCLKKLHEICNDGSFLRVLVDGGGCSGFQYKFEMDDKLNEDDQSFGSGNAKVVIDQTSLEYCAGATLDYHSELIRSGFRIIDNPKAEMGCSCGASFSIKLD